MAEPLLAVRGLSVAYAGVPAVRGIDLDVARGEVVALVGANGAGKTTILSAISGTVGFGGGRIGAGRVLLEGQDVTGRPAHRLVALGLSHVPEGREILARLTVAENLDLGAYQRSDRAAVAADVEVVYERFPILGQRRHQLAGSLSGGEQQMLAISRGLLGRPRLLLLDEPSLGLAPQAVRAVFEEVDRIRRAGTTVLLVEQNARQALALADRGYVLETGSIVLAGTGAELSRNERVIDAYLGLPPELGANAAG
ncbi:MAG TPA: ABC transporter ATP-binding protein [Candidatus Limnocylindrales bacterium]|nr:ABC transporter ATP-binding protein [Candidatus Limnocylindrales bacterium]